VPGPDSILASVIGVTVLLKPYRQNALPINPSLRFAYGEGLKRAKRLAFMILGRVNFPKHDLVTQLLAEWREAYWCQALRLEIPRPRIPDTLRPPKTYWNGPVRPGLVK
jgi:hypothetical protein